MRRGQSLVGRAKKTPEEHWESIEAKCHPAIFELAQLWKESINGRKDLGPNPSEEARAELQTKVDKRLEEIHRKYSGSVPPAPGTFPAQTIFSKTALESKSGGQGVAEFVHWERHKVSLEKDSQRMQEGDWDASRRVQRTLSDLEQLRCGKGPIRPFKGDLEHSNMFGTLWGFGLERLTPEDLADFFDKYCPCGIEAHDPDALKKQRSRFRKALERASVCESPRKD